MNRSEGGFDLFVNPGASAPGKTDNNLRPAIGDLYAVISALDAAGQSDLAGRLHALTLEIRERAARGRARPLSRLSLVPR